MCEGDHTFRLREADGMWVGALIVSVVSSFAVETVLAGRTFPNSMFGLELSTEAAAVGEREGTTGAASRCFLVVILGHSMPPKTMVAGVFYGRS